MRAAVLQARGEPPVPGEFADPEPTGEDPVLEVLVAGLNPIDLTIAAGRVPAREREHPSVPGLEGVGELDGRRYYFDTPLAPYGSIAERALVERESLIEVPDGLDPGLAVSLGVAGFAAWLALTWRTGLRPGESVLVLGASGVVGQLAVQAARLLGAGKVVAAARDGAGLERARHQLGADAVVQLGGEGDLAEHLREAVGGGYDVVVDPLWGEPAIAALAALNRDGRLISVGNAAGESAELAVRDFRNRLGRIIGHTNFQAPARSQTRGLRDDGGPRRRRRARRPRSRNGRSRRSPPPGRSRPQAPTTSWSYGRAEALRASRARPSSRR